jgi:hypothetical protein
MIDNLGNAKTALPRNFYAHSFQSIYIPILSTN